MKDCCLNDKGTVDVLIQQLKREVCDLMKTTTARLLAQDGKIASVCTYIKENLSASIMGLLDSMKMNGELDRLIASAVDNTLAVALTYEPAFDKLISVKTHRNEDMKTSYTITKIKPILKPHVNFTNGTTANPYTDMRNVIDYMKTVNKPVAINAGLRGVTVKDGVSHIESNDDGDEGYYILAMDINGKLKAFPRTATGTDIINAGYRDAINIWSPIVEKGVFFDETVLDSTHEDYDYIFNEKHPRQVLGVLEDGSYIVITTEGRMVDEEGLNFKQLKQLVQELGCVSAYNLDGGASAQTVVNKQLITRELSKSRVVGTVITFEGGVDYVCKC